MPDIQLHFDTQSAIQSDRYKLIELPKELMDVAQGITDQRFARPFLACAHLADLVKASRSVAA